MQISIWHVIKVAGAGRQ